MYIRMQESLKEREFEEREGESFKKERERERKRGVRNGERIYETRDRQQHGGGWGDRARVEDDTDCTIQCTVVYTHCSPQCRC